MKLTAIAFFVLLSLGYGHAGDSYDIDLSHSSILFAVDHQNVAKAYGRFNNFSGEIVFDENDPTKSKFDITIDMNSVDTANERRDKHLRSPDFFTVKQFPEATFKTTKVQMKGDKMHVHGDFTMAGKTQPVTVEMTTRGPVDVRGKAVRGFEGQTTVVRSKHGVEYGMGGIGDEVTIMISIEAIRK